MAYPALFWTPLGHIRLPPTAALAALWIPAGPASLRFSLDPAACSTTRSVLAPCACYGSHFRQHWLPVKSANGPLGTKPMVQTMILKFIFIARSSDRTSSGDLKLNHGSPLIWFLMCNC